MDGIEPDQEIAPSPEEMPLPGEIIIDVCFNIRAFVDDIDLQTQLIQQLAGLRDSQPRFHPPEGKPDERLSLTQMCGRITQTTQQILHFEAIADVCAFTKLSADNDPEWMDSKLIARGVTPAELSRWLTRPPRALLLAVLDEIRPLIRMLQQYAQALRNAPEAKTVLVDNVRPVTLRELAEELLLTIQKPADYLQDVRDYAQKRLK